LLDRCTSPLCVQVSLPQQAVRLAFFRAALRSLNCNNSTTKRVIVDAVPTMIGAVTDPLSPELAAVPELMAGCLVDVRQVGNQIPLTAAR
jgi:hypothetical protein